MCRCPARKERLSPSPCTSCETIYQCGKPAAREGSGLSALVLANVPFVLIGGIAALRITGVNFSISAGIGFIALLGMCMQKGIVPITVFKDNLRKKISLAESLRLGVASRVRPVVMTAFMAMIGLFPAALDHGQQLRNAEAAGHRDYRRAGDGHGAYFPVHLRFFLP